MLNQNQINLPDIDEAFEKFVRRVLETQTFGVTRKPIELRCVSSSSKKKADRFTFAIPYARHTLQWTVLFNSNCPEMGPDFEFHDELFLANPDCDTIETHIPSLANWEAIKPDSLLCVLNELTLCYKQHQIDLLSRNEQHLHLQYTTLIDNADVCSKDVEIILLPDAESPNEVRFVIQLAMDFSRLPGRSHNAVNDAAMLTITYQQQNWNKGIPLLHLSTTLEETFNKAGFSNLSIPPLSRDQSVVDYVTHMKKMISDKIDSIIDCYEKRMNFVSTLLFFQRRNVVEYDATDFTRITILLEEQDFYFLVHFILSPTFPAQQPNVMLQSIYHVNPKTDELVTHPVSRMLYSPRWESKRMIAEILKQVVQKDAICLRNAISIR
ncbi:BRISC and BRCA1-A complex member 2-like [Venturia canescens]|uniref:BRISC and BRCA1-A complex member 2-like n=1 Tax=Venturia canescens TaxID=32260 RepID=UPI001C9CF12C|nr:BRISC and BRCA1-A complex member 2-like [Venturia canescens]XP_043270774.1 BRISC and BRCA1-A complex member 2-like [Venturia canescens]XP_043270775.1 BRISC and BRCA1-A complex member 2-like [Venturia canescens]XP_043270776.1 BRISC and BRCA1-A complex member 2-like [Venturia canescens]